MDRHGISHPRTFYNWRARFGGMGVSEARRLRQLDEENRKLKQPLFHPSQMHPYGGGL